MKKWLSFFMVLLCLMPQMLYADECSDSVFDAAGVFGSGRTQIEAEVQRFEKDFGARVRLQAIRDFAGYSSFDAYIRHLQSTCDVWQSPNNGKLISLVVSFGSKKDLGLYYGDFWKSELDPYNNQIRDNKVKPLLRSGDYVEAFTTMLTEIEKVLKMPTVQQQVVPIVRDSVPTVVVQKDAVDLSGLWTFLKYLLICIIIGLVLATIYWVMKNKKLEAEKKSAAQRKAQGIKVQCSSFINELQVPMSRSSASISTLKDKVDIIDIPNIAKLYTQAQKLYESAKQTYANMPSKMNPDIEDISVAEYVTIAQAYGEILTTLSDAGAKNSTVLREIDKIKQRINNAPKRISVVEECINDVAKEVESISAEGYIVVPMQTRLDNAREFIAQAKKALLKRSYSDVFVMCKNAQDEALIASTNASNLPELRDDILGSISSVESDIEITRKIISEGKEIFFSIREEYLASAWTPIRGNGTEAEKAIGAAVEIVQEIKYLASMKKQDWERAQILLEQVETLVEQACSLINSITELKKNLDRAKNNVVAEIEDAQADIVKADSYISMYDADIDDDLWREVSAAREDIERAIVLLRDIKPDYIRAMHLAMRANKSADVILDQAEDEHEMMVRKRRRLETARIAAKKSLSAAEEYLQDHRSDISSRARQKIQDARSTFDNAYSSVDDVIAINKTIAYMKDVSEVASSGLDIAQDDVYDAQSSISGGSSTWGTSIGSIGGSSSGGWSTGGGSIGGFSSGGWSSGGGGISGGSSGGW